MVIILFLPEIAQGFRCKETDDDNEHYRLAQQPEARLVQLRGIDILAVRNRSEIVHKAPADLENEEKSVRNILFIQILVKWPL